MAYDKIADISIALQTTATSTAGFGTPLFLTTHKRFIDRVRSYPDLESVSDDFEASDNAYIAAQTFFAADPKPNLFKVGRVKGDSLFTVGSVTEGAIFSVDLGVNENVTAPFSYTALNADDEEAVVDALIIAIDATHATELSATKVGTGSTAQLSITPVGDNEFVVGDLVGLTEGLTSTETVIEAKNACEDVDDDFYWVTSEFKDETSVTSLALDTEATKRFYMISLSNSDNLTSYSDQSTDISAALYDIGGERSSGFYHNEADRFAELGVIAEFTTVEPGTKDYYAKQIATFGVSKNPDTGVRLTNSEKTSLQSRYMNYIEKQGGIPIYIKGLSFSGNQIGNLVFRDFLEARLTEAYTAWRINRDKIPYDQAGIDSSETVFRSVCDRYVSTQERPHAISSYVSNFPRVEDVSFNDKANGLLKAVATIYLTGSIFTVDLDGILTYDASF